MKKVLLFALSTFAVASMNAQDCSSSIDFTATALGFNPNPIVGSNATVPYDEVITIVIPNKYPANVPGVGLTDVPLSKIKLMTITPETQFSTFFDPAPGLGYTYEVWVKNFANNNYEEITVGGSNNIFEVSQTDNFTYACLRMKNTNPPAPVIFPEIDTVNIAVQIDAFATFPIVLQPGGEWVRESSIFGVAVTDEDLTFNVRFPVRAKTVSVAEVDPNSFAIYSTYPNPATTEAWVKFSTPVSGNATLKVYDITGKTVVNSLVPTIAGVNNLQVDVSNLNAGIYLYSLTIGNETVTSKMVVAK